MNFDTVVFAGGGCRCVWSSGFWTVVGPCLARPKRILSVSAGAIVAVNAMVGVSEDFLRLNRRSFDRNRSDFHLRRGLRGENPFPHPLLVRRALTAVYDERTIERLRSAPPIHVMAAAVPTGRPRPLSIIAGQSAYLVNKLLVKRMHSDWALKIGFRPVWRLANDCASADELRALLLASGAVPPVFPSRRLDGQPVVDGGMIDNAPVDLQGRPLGRMLVLLTRRYRRIPELADRLYVQPSEPLPVGVLDATSGGRMQAAFDLGRADGDAFLQRYAFARPAS